MTRARTPRKRGAAPLSADWEATLASLQAAVMAPAAAAPSPRWSRLHRALDDLARRGESTQRVRSAFLIPLA